MRVLGAILLFAAAFYVCEAAPQIVPGMSGLLGPGTGGSIFNLDYNMLGKQTKIILMHMYQNDGKIVGLEVFWADATFALYGNAVGARTVITTPNICDNYLARIEVKADDRVRAIGFTFFQGQSTGLIGYPNHGGYIYTYVTPIGSQITDFYGSAGTSIDTIGAYSTFSYPIAPPVPTYFDAYGLAGPWGGDQDGDTNNPNGPYTWNPAVFNLYISSDRVEGVQVVFVNGHSTPVYGNTGGSAYPVVFPGTDWWCSGVEIFASTNKVHRIAFWWSHNSLAAIKSPFYGNSGGQGYFIRAATGYFINSFWGRITTGSRLDALGFYESRNTVLFP